METNSEFNIDGMEKFSIDINNKYIEYKLTPIELIIIISDLHTRLLTEIFSNIPDEQKENAIEMQINTLKEQIIENLKKYSSTRH